MTNILFLLMTGVLVAESSENHKIRLIISSGPEKPQFSESHLLDKQSFIKKGISPVKIEFLNVPKGEDSSSNDIWTLLDKLVGGENVEESSDYQKPENKRISEVCSCSCRPNNKNPEAFEETPNELTTTPDVNTAKPRIFQYKDLYAKPHIFQYGDLFKPRIFPYGDLFKPRIFQYKV